MAGKGEEDGELYAMVMRDGYARWLCDDHGTIMRDDTEPGVCNPGLQTLGLLKESYCVLLI